MRLALIAAMSLNRVIGINGTLPWHIPEDLKHFRRLTLGKPVIMGRKTFESIGRALPKRHNVVITRQLNFQAEEVSVVHSLDDAVHLFEGAEEVMVIGGAEIYEQALPIAKRMYLTVVETTLEGDTLFPSYDKEAWLELERDSIISQATGLKLDFITLGRRQ